MSSIPPSQYIGNAVSFGLTATMRITALGANCVAALAVGELVIRLARESLSYIGFISVKDDAPWSKFGDKLSSIGLRPFKEYKTRDALGADVVHNTTAKVIKIALGTAVFSAVATEFVRLFGGTIHPAYNNVLAFIGPMRFSNDSYLEGVSKVLRGTVIGDTIGL